MAGLRHLWPRRSSAEAHRKEESDGRYPASSCGPRNQRHTPLAGPFFLHRLGYHGLSLSSRGS